MALEWEVSASLFPSSTPQIPQTRLGGGGGVAGAIFDRGAMSLRSVALTPFGRVGPSAGRFHQIFRILTLPPSLPPLPALRQW